MILVEPRVEVEPFNGIKIMKNIERACRTCYRSENSITEDSYKKLLSNCINRGHESVLEHEKITIRLTCDIGTYKDLSRHRHASFSIESTRYCNYTNDRFDNQIKFINPIFSEDKNKMKIWRGVMHLVEYNYNALAKIGAKPDELRMLLPHSTAAEVTMTANIREWRHILSLRASEAAHPTVRQVMIPLLKYFKQEMPELFNSISYDTEFPVSKYARVVVMEENNV